MNKETKSRKKTLSCFALRLIGFIVLMGSVMLYGIYVLTPKHDYGICPMINLYRQPRNSVDVLVAGSSLAYSGANTNVLWKAYGISGYDLCGAEQPFWSTYYQLKEALRFQRPKVIVLDAKAAVYTRDYSTRSRTILSTYGILSLDHRTGAIFSCVDQRQALDLLLAYPEVHNRYSAVSPDDFMIPPTNGGRGATWKGYIETDLVEAHDYPFTSRSSNKKKMKPRVEEYVRKIFDLAQEEDIPLLVVAFPNPDYGNDWQYFNSLWKVAEECGIPYIDYNDPSIDLGLDYSLDFADWQHLNVRGSMKMSMELGRVLKERFDLADHRGDPAYASYDECAGIWFNKLDTFKTAPLQGTIDF